MGLAVKIAWRNLWRHKGRSLALGLILFTGGFFTTVGNGLLSGMNRGLAENIVNLFTGDVIILSAEQEEDSVLLDPLNQKPPKVIKDYEQVAEVLAKEEMVREILPAVTGKALVLETGGDLETLMLVGVDIERYQEVFPENFRLLEGRVFAPGERGILFSRQMREYFYNHYNLWYLPEGEEVKEEYLPEEARAYKDGLELRRSLVFMGLSPAGALVDVRVPVTGIIEYRELNMVWGSYCLVDIETFGEAHHYVTGADAGVELPAGKKDLLATANLDALFTDEDLFIDVGTHQETPPALSLEQIRAEVKREKPPRALAAGAYNLIFLRLQEGVAQAEALAGLNRIFAERDLAVRAVGWQQAIGVFGNKVAFTKVAVNLFIMFLFFVIVVVIMNALSLAALERTPELAMMRAVGAAKGFLAKMFLVETMELAFFFSGLGVAAGVVFIYLLRAAGITTENEILQLVYGGSRLAPVLTGSDLLLVLFQLLLVTILSVLYPLRIVWRIKPPDAMAGV